MMWMGASVHALCVWCIIYLSSVIYEMINKGKNKWYIMHIVIMNVSHIHKDS